MRLKKLGSINFVGGINTRVDSTNIKTNEFTTLRNVNLINGTLKRRDGFTKRGTVSRLVAELFDGKSYIKIPDHNNYNTYHVGSAYEDLSMYWQIQIQLSNSSGYVGTPLPIIYKKDSFFLFIDTNDKLNLYWKRRNVDTLLTSPYTLTDLHSFTTANQAIMSLGVQFNNGSGSNTAGITLYVDGMKVTEDKTIGTSADSFCWDDYNAPNFTDGPIYLGYYDGLDYSSAGAPYNSDMYFQGRMLDFRIYRTDSTTTSELAVTENNKKRYCWGNLPASKQTDAFLKGYWKLGDNHEKNVSDEISTNNTGEFITNGGTRSNVNIGTINTRMLRQFRNQSGTNKMLLDGGQAIYEEEGQGDLFPIWYRDPDLINTQDSVSPTYTSIPDMEIVNNRAHLAIGEETPLKHDGNTIVKLGITPPSTAPVFISAGAGLLNGSYNWKYTFYRSDISLESNPSPVYSTTASSEWIRIYLERPQDRQVDQIKLYRTTAGGSTYLLVATLDAFTLQHGSATINNASGIDYIDNTPDASLSTTEMPTTYNTPPILQFFAEHHERLFGAGDPNNPSRLYYSNTTNVEYFTASDYIDIGLTQEGKITGLNYSRDKVYVFKEKAIWQLYGAIETDFVTQYLNKEVGCIAKYSRAMIGDLIFFASIDGVYTLDGNTGQLENISEKIKTDYLDLNFNNVGTWLGILNKRYNQYILITDTETFVYDYSLKSWCNWDVDIEAGENFFESGKDEIYTAYDVNNIIYIFHHNDGLNDGAYLEGVVEEYTTTTITDSQASFTDLTGFPIYLYSLDGTYQRKKITSNTTTKITVDSAFSPSLTPGYRYSVGGIPVIMETGWIDLENPQRHKMYSAVDFVYDINVNSKLIMAFTSVDNAGTYDKVRLLDFTSGSGSRRWSMLRRGQFMKLKIFAPVGGFSFEIKKIVYGIDERQIR